MQYNYIDLSSYLPAKLPIVYLLIVLYPDNIATLRHRLASLLLQVHTYLLGVVLLFGTAHNLRPSPSCVRKKQAAPARDYSFRLIIQKETNYYLLKSLLY